MKPYVESFIRHRGQDCLVVGSQKRTKISLHNPSRAVRDVVAKDAFFEGLVPTESGIVPGDLLEINNGLFLVRSVRYEFASEHLLIQVSQINAMLTIKRRTEKVPDDDPYSGRVEVEWTTVETDVPATAEGVINLIKETNAGLLDGTAIIMWVSAKHDIKVMDHIYVGGMIYRVDGIDNLSLPGILHIRTTVARGV